MAKRKKISSVKKGANREETLELAMTQIQQQYGVGAIMRLGESKIPREIGVIPTGALSLDIALGIGGIPRGRVIEIYGPEASGKTTMSLHIVAEAQKLGGVAAFIDVEHALDPSYARVLGVDVENLLVSQPSSAEEALEITDVLVKSGACDIIVVDSVAALVPRAEIEGAMGDSHVGLQARLMSQALRKLTASVSRSKTAVLFLNQIRMKIGVMFGNPQTTPGGMALKFYSSVRLEVRRAEAIKTGTEHTGFRGYTKVVKNKVAPPFKKAEYEIIFGKGIIKEGCLLDLGLQEGLLSRSGTWISYQDQNIGQGRMAAINYLQENSEVAAQIEKTIREQYGLTDAVAKKQGV